MPLRELTFREEKLRAIFYLVIVPAMIGLVLVLILLNYRHSVEQARAQARINKAQIAESRRQIKVLRNALSETCHATTAEYGIVTALTLYFAAQTPTQPTRAVIDSLAGWATDLSTRSACGKLTNP